MSMRTQLMKALDEEIPISPGEFGPEARHASIRIARWRRANPDSVFTAAVIVDALKETWKYYGTANLEPFEQSFLRVADRVLKSGKGKQPHSGEI